MSESSKNPRDPDSLLEHRAFVEMLARQLVYDPGARDDVVQDTMLAALRNPPRADRWRAWLRRVVRNLAYRTRRDQARRYRRESHAARPDIDPGPGPAERLTWHKEVVDALLGLDEPYRETLLLRFYEDCSPKQIAGRLGLPGGTVRARLKRGLDQLRARLDADHDRRTWMLALAPLAFPQNPPPLVSTGAALTKGAIAMEAKRRVFVGVMLIVALATTVGVVSRFTGEREGGQERTAMSREPAPAPVDTHAEMAESSAPKAKPGREVRVRATDWSNQPIAGARIEVVKELLSELQMGTVIAIRTDRWRDFHRPADVLEVARTNRAGAATVHGSPEYSLRVSANGFGTAVRTLPHLKELVVRLSRGFALRGRIVDEQGAPVAGATVLASSGVGAPFGHVRPLRAITDATGHYEFAALERGLQTLWAARPGAIAHRIVTLRFPDVATFDFVLESGAVLTGRVTDRETERGLAGAVVDVWTRADPVVQRGRAVTDKDGRYRIESFSRGWVAQWRVTCGGYVHGKRVQESVKSPVRLDPQSDAVLDFALFPEGVLEGVVRGPDGPLAGAVVHTWNRHVVVRRATADGKGRYRLDRLPAGQHLVTVSAEGHRRNVELGNPWQVLSKGGPMVIDIVAGGKHKRDFELKQADPTKGPPKPKSEVVEPMVRGVVAGAVRDTVVLCAMPVSGGPNNGWATRQRLQRWRNAIRFPVGEDGRFEFAWPSRGCPRVELRAVGPGRASGAIVALDRGAHGGVELRFEAGLTLRGVASPGTRISVARPLTEMDRYHVGLQGGPDPVVAIIADAEGAFVVGPLGVGKWEVEARRPGHSPARALVTLPQAQPIHLAPQPLTAIQGTVVWPDGTPVVDAGVSTRRVDKNGRIRMDDPMIEHEVRTDASGQFLVRDRRPGRHRVSVRGGDRANLIQRSLLAEAGATKLRIVVERGLSIEGRIVDQTGKGVEGTIISAQAGSAISAADGGFRIMGLGAGGHRLRISKGAKVAVRRKVAAGTRGLVIVFDPAQDFGKIAGVLLDDAGRPMAGRDLSAGGPSFESRRSAKTGPDGKFVLADLSRGRHTVTLRRGGSDPALQFRKVLGEFETGTRNVVLHAQPGETLAGRIVDERGGPVVGAYVMADRVWLKVGDDGRFLLRGFDPGEALTVKAWQFGWIKVELKVLAGTEDLRIVLQPGVRTTGIVRGAKEKTILRFYWLGGEAPRASTSVGNGGRFEVGELRPGRHRVVVRRGGKDTQIGVIEAGAPDITLSLPE